jgi:hypothetical protein
VKHKAASDLNLYYWPESASELYRSNDRRLSAKLLTTSADKGSHVVSVTDCFGRILDFLDHIIALILLLMYCLLHKLFMNALTVDVTLVQKILLQF